MATIVFPLLLILGALGGVFVVLGRRLPDIRRVMEKRPEATSASSESSEIVLGPRGTSLERPERASQGIVRKIMETISRGSVPFLRILFRVGMQGIRLFFHMFHRLPVAERVPQPGTRNGSSHPGLPVSPPTTADVKRTTGRTLRFPEPLPQRMNTPEESQSLIDGSLPSGVEPSESIMSPSQKQPSIPETFVPPTLESVAPSVTVETTREVRSRKNRRVMGRIRPRKASGGDPTEIQEPLPPAVSEESSAPSSDSEQPRMVEEPMVGRPTDGRGSPDGRPVGWVSTAQTIPALIEEGKYGRAESLLIDILSKDPRDTEAYKLLGTVYLRRQEYAQAREVFEEALRRDPHHPGIPGLLGETYFAAGEYGKALSMYQRAHDADETNMEYLEKLLAIFSRMDRRPMVNVTAKKILAMNPEHEQAKKVLARAEVG